MQRSDRPLQKKKQISSKSTILPVPLRLAAVRSKLILYLQRASTVIASVTVAIVGSEVSASAATVIGGPIDQGSEIGSLPDGNYRFCSTRTALLDSFELMRSPSTVDERPSTHACLRFRKQADQVVGDYYYPADGASICFTGSVQRDNRIAGQALERLLIDAPLMENYQQSDLKNWRPAGFLQVSGGSTRELATSGMDAMNSTRVVRYENAVLSLDGFYQYNAGRALPPSSCTQRLIPNFMIDVEDLVEVGDSTYYNQPIYLYESSVRNMEDDSYSFATLVGVSTPLNIGEYRVNCTSAEDAQDGGKVAVGGAQLVRSRQFDSDGDTQGIEGTNPFSEINPPAAPERTIQPSVTSRYVCSEYAQIELPSPSTAAPLPEEEPTEAEPTTISTDVTYKRYRNDLFDYSMLYPVGIVTPQDLMTPEGQTFRSETGDVEIKVYGVDRRDGQTLQERYEAAQTGRDITYRTLVDDDFFVVSGREDGEVFYRKTFLENSVFKVLELRYDQDLYRNFARIANVIGDSFAPAQTGSDLAQLPTEVQTAILRSVSNNTEAESAIFQVVAVEPRTWPDGCLGLPRAEEGCTQALVPGWRVRLEAEVAGGVLTFTYRTDETGDTLRFE